MSAAAGAWRPWNLPGVISSNPLHAPGLLTFWKNKAMRRIMFRQTVIPKLKKKF